MFIGPAEGRGRANREVDESSDIRFLFAYGRILLLPPAFVNP
jgi:hypothetical protein